jgi:hypothetical protein
MKKLDIPQIAANNKKSKLINLGKTRVNDYV